MVSRNAGMAGLAALFAAQFAAPASAYLFWTQPQLKGEPVTGEEPGMTVPLPDATPKEVKANLLWAMRAGLNVAALQCQFSPALMTVNNYNGLLKQHSTELKGAYDVLQAYFKRTGGKTWQTTLDQYTTRTYNGFSTFHAQLEFCDTAASIGRDALALSPNAKAGKLAELAASRMREFRNSLVPTGDTAFVFRPESVPPISAPVVGCVDRKGRPKACTG